MAICGAGWWGIWQAGELVASAVDMDTVLQLARPAGVTIAAIGATITTWTTVRAGRSQGSSSHRPAAARR